MEMIYSLDCGSFPLRYSFIFPETSSFFANYLTESPDCSSNYDIRLTQAVLEECRWLVDENEESLSFLEFQSLMLATGNTLLSHRRALFHGPALLWKEKAWIITAPSGTGKTTQLRHWKNLLKRDVKIINGDKPLLRCKEDGSVWVYASPWRGKERYGVMGLNAPLGGIILLKQGSDNSIRNLSPEDAVLPLFTEFISFPENAEQIRCQVQILKQILDSVPVWELINLGDEASAALTLDTLAAYLEGMKDHE